MLPILLKDGYKASHREQYPAGTEFIYSNFTPRSNKYGKAEKVVVFGLHSEILNNGILVFFVGIKQHG